MYNRRLIIGLWRVKLHSSTESVYRYSAYMCQLQISPIHLTDVSSAVCYWKQTCWNEIHRHVKFWLRALESESVFTKALCEYLRLFQGYFSPFFFCFFVFVFLLFCQHHLLPLLTALFFFKFIFWSSLFTLKSLWHFFSSLLQTGTTCYTASHLALSGGGPTVSLSCRLRGRLQV